MLDPQNLTLAHVADWAALGDEMANQLVLVFACPVLPGSIEMAEVDVGHIVQGIVQPCELRSVIRGKSKKHSIKYNSTDSLLIRICATIYRVLIHDFFTS